MRIPVQRLCAPVLAMQQSARYLLVTSLIPVGCHGQDTKRLPVCTYEFCLP